MEKRRLRKSINAYTLSRWGCTAYIMPQYRVNVDFGNEGVEQVEIDAKNVGVALRKAYELALDRRTNPVSVNVVRVIEEAWETTSPVMKQ